MYACCMMYVYDYDRQQTRGERQILYVNIHTYTIHVYTYTELDVTATKDELRSSRPLILDRRPNSHLMLLFGGPVLGAGSHPAYGYAHVNVIVCVVMAGVCPALCGCMHTHHCILSLHRGFWRQRNMDSQARRLAPSVGPHFLTEFARVAHTSQDVPASHVSVQAGQSNVSNARLPFAGARICGVVKALSRGLPRETVTVVVG